MEAPKQKIPNRRTDVSEEKLITDPFELMELSRQEAYGRGRLREAADIATLIERAKNKENGFSIKDAEDQIGIITGQINEGF